MNIIEESKDIYQIANYIFNKNPEGENAIQLIFERDDLEHVYKASRSVYDELPQHKN